MLPLALLAPALISGGASIAGALINRGSRGTSTQNIDQTTMPILPPNLQVVFNNMLGASQSRITNAPQTVLPFKLAAKDRVNRMYAGAPQALRNKYHSGQGGTSGKYGMAAFQTEMGRYGSLADLESQFAEMALSEQDKGYDMMDRLLRMSMGSTTKGTTAGTQTQSGNVLGGAVGGGLESLTTLWMLNNLLKGGNSGAMAI